MSMSLIPDPTHSDLSPERHHHESRASADGLLRGSLTPFEPEYDSRWFWDRPESLGRGEAETRG
jgi:hypothetical protein